MLLLLWVLVVGVIGVCFVLLGIGLNVLGLLWFCKNLRLIWGNKVYVRILFIEFIVRVILCCLISEYNLLVSLFSFGCNKLVGW